LRTFSTNSCFATRYLCNSNQRALMNESEKNITQMGTKNRLKKAAVHGTHRPIPPRNSSQYYTYAGNKEAYRLRSVTNLDTRSLQ
jgi:hypothetical protein